MRLFARKLGGLPVLGLAAATSILDVATSIAHHVNIGTGLDLALADQAVWHYSRFQAPLSSILGKDILGDHFSPLVALLTPLYWVWSDPRSLLIAQGVLIGASVIPVFLFARARLSEGSALLLAAAYACFWGLQVGALFDFHELAFAPLLIALAILFSDKALAGERRHWTGFWVAIALLLLVKEDLSMFVVFFGVYLMTKRELAHGAVLVIVGVGWYLVATKLLIPDLSNGYGYEHWTYSQLGKDLPSALWTLVKAPWRVFTIAFAPAEKVKTMLALLTPFLFLSLGSRLFILAIPLLAERFLSLDRSFWGTSYQYSLSIAPVLAMAAADVLACLGRTRALRVHRPLIVAPAAAMLVTSVLLSVLDTSESTLHQIFSPAFYSAPSYASAAYRAIAHVPTDASLATVDELLPHVSERRDVFLIDPGSAARTSYVIADVKTPVCCATGNASYSSQGELLNAELAHMTPTYFDDGWLVAERPRQGAPGNGVLVPVPERSALRVQHRTQALVHAYVGAFLCGASARVRGSTGSACGPWLKRLTAADRGYARTLAAASPALDGGCATIYLAARLAAGRAVQDGIQLLHAVASGERTALEQAWSRALFDANHQDLIGRISRFPLLCSPRSRA